jgi:hypothetical protein
VTAREYADSRRAARHLALDIIARRRRLDEEEEARRQARLRGVKGGSLPGRGTRLVSADRQVAEGMVLALSYLLGKPGEYWTAEQFITEHDQEETQ